MRSRALRKKHTPVDKSVLAVSADARWEDRDYLNSMRDSACIVTGRHGTDYESIDPAHLRLGFLGVGRKPHDFHCLPLAHSEHLKQSASSEGAYWLRVINEQPYLLGEFAKAYGVMRYLRWKLGIETDRQVVAAITEMMG